MVLYSLVPVTDLVLWLWVSQLTSEFRFLLRKVHQRILSVPWILGKCMEKGDLNKSF